MVQQLSSDIISLTVVQNKEFPRPLSGSASFRFSLFPVQPLSGSASYRFLIILSKSTVNVIALH